MYHFYILRCSDNSLYCGMTSNLDKRLKEHNSSGTKGAKYLRAKKPVVVVYSEQYPDIKTAMKREFQVKKWAKARKEALVKGDLTLLKKLKFRGKSTNFPEIDGSVGINNPSPADKTGTKGAFRH